MSRTVVIVITHNSEEVIVDCLASCRGLDVLVIDNGSRDQTLSKVRQHGGVRIIANEGNSGFAGAVNQGVRATDADSILLLNPDARLESTPGPLIDVLDNDATCGIVAGLLTGEDGAVQSGFTARRFPQPATLAFEALGINRLAPWNPVNRRYRYADRNFSEAVEVDQPAGAFLLFRRTVWEALGGFDERFHPVWFEDVDFCRRAKTAGYRIVLVPSVRAVHAGGHSVKRLGECREGYWYGSLLKYAAKHFSARKARAVGAAVVLGSVLRAIAGAATTRSLKPFQIYSKVIRAASVCVVSGRVPDIAC